jgi:hypothetical protein
MPSDSGTKVASKPSKKRILVDFFRLRGAQRIEMNDLQAARNELRCHLGSGDRTSLGYIASVLRETGYEVQYEDRYSDPVMPEPYATHLKGALEFRDLASAEQSLLRLDEIYREYGRADDPLGVKLVWTLVKKGKLRAQRLAASPRVRESKRKEKEEIARWFQVWLETPDLFADWLALRKSSDEFRQTFAPAVSSE